MSCIVMIHIAYYFFLLVFFALKILRPDLSPPPVLPSEKLPPPWNSRLCDAWKGDGFCGGVLAIGWPPNWNGLAIVGGVAGGAPPPKVKLG